MDEKRMRDRTKKRKWSLLAGRVAVVAAVAFAGASAKAVDKKNGQGFETKKIGNRRTGAVPARPSRSAPTPTAAEVKGPKPIIHVDESVQDFGVVWTGPDLEHTFVISNKGDADLKIERVKPSCGCTIAGNYPRTIAPGDSGKFPFKMKSAKLHKHFVKSVTITSNDPVTPDLRLKLQGEVKNYVDVDPPSANFGKIIGQAKKERVLRVTNNTETPLELELTNPADKRLDWELVPVEKGQVYELRVSTNPPHESGNINVTALLKTNIEAQKQISVVARAAIPERLEAQPRSINIPKSRAGSGTKGLTRVVRVNNYGDEPVRVLEATIDDPTVTLTVNERTPGKAYTILVQMPPGYEPPASGRTIAIKTNDKEKPMLTVSLVSPASRTAERPKRRSADELVGKPAPRISLSTDAGKSLSNADFNGKVTVLDFFAVNCGFCKKQIPRVEQVRKQYAGNDNVRFVAVAQTMRKEYSEADCKAKLTDLGFQGEFAYNPSNDAGQAYNATGFPTMIIVGKDGKVGAANVGNVGDLESRMKTQIDALLAGKPVPSTGSKSAEKPRQRPAGADGNIGKPAPTFSVTTLDGKPLNNAELAKSKATVLDFFAPNCGYCKKQIPRLETVREKYESQGVRFVAVSQKMRKEYPVEEVKQILEPLNWKGELAINHDNSMGGAFGARGFPTMVVLGSSGKVEAVNVGNIGDLEERVAGQLDALIAGKPIPAKYATKPRQAKSRRRPAEDLVGKKAPDFTTQTVEGKTVSSADFGNHPATVLNFVAPNCGFCKKQIPNVEKIREKYEKQGVRFVNMAMTMRKEYSVEDTIKVFEGVGSKLELAKDAGNKIGSSYKAQSFPTMIVVGKDGNIAHVNIGAKPNMDQLLSSQLDGLIKKAN